jgi:ankyrin repeat protein
MLQSKAFGDITLYDAVMSRDMAAFNYLLFIGANVDAAGSAGSPLYVAASRGDLPVVVALLDNFADVNIAGPHEERPIHAAAKGGHLEVLLALLDRGADIDSTRDDGATALLLAVCLKNQRIVNALLRRGADVNLEATSSLTPLFAAIKAGHLEMIDILLSYNASTTKEDKFGACAIHYAAGGLGDSGLRILQAILSKTNIEDINQIPKRKMGEIKKDYLLRAKTPLQIAIRCGQEDMIMAFIRVGAVRNYMFPIYNGKNIFQIAISKKYLKLSSFLFNEKFRKDSDEITKSPLKQEVIERVIYENVSLLREAVKSQNHEIVRIIIDSNSLMRTITKEDVETFIIAIKNKDYLTISELLRDEKFKINILQNNGNILHDAIIMRDVGLIRTLLDNGFDINKVREDGNTPLCLAIESGDSNVVRLLLAKDANLSKPGFEGRPPLLVAILEKNVEMFNILLEKGAKLDQIFNGKEIFKLIEDFKDPSFLEIKSIIGRQIALGVGVAVGGGSSALPRPSILRSAKLQGAPLVPEFSKEARFK